MSKKIENPENLYLRNGVWWIRYSVAGQKIRRSLGTTSLREAKHMRDQILGKRSAAAKFGIETPTAQPVKTFGQIAALWLDARQADDSLAPGTRTENARIVRSVLLPEFGPMLMSAITVEDVERFIGRLRQKYKRATVAQHYRILRLVIRQAIKRGWYVGPNPLERLERAPTQGPGRDVALTFDEAQRLLAQLSGVLYYKVALALYTGLRWGEVHGLAWADLDLDSESPTLTVRRSYRGKPKNEASAATIPLSHEAAALLRRWQAEQGEGMLWVFPDRHGRLFRSDPSWLTCQIHEAAKRAGIDKRITPHVFRHSFGTWVYEQTGDLKKTQRLMRHGSFATTMGYVHDRRELGPVVNALPRLTGPHLKAV